MSNKVSPCLYIDRKVIETSKQNGLNISNVAENSLVEAIGRLTGQKLVAGLASLSPVIVEAGGRARL